MARPKSPLITRQLAVKAALRLIDKRGVDGLNMRALADELGVNGASFYHHFANKEEILEAVARYILAGFPMSEVERQSWEDFMVDSAKVWRRALLRHPNAILLMLRFHPRKLAPELYHVPATKMEDADTPPPELYLTIVDALEGLAIGSALSSAFGVTEHLRRASAGDDALRQMLEANAYDDEERFEVACRGLIRGLMGSQRALAANASSRKRS